MRIDYCIIGAATCNNILGDTLKIGRRGSLNGFININGKQGHVAYVKNNIIHDLDMIINNLKQLELEFQQVAQDFPKTSFNITY